MFQFTWTKILSYSGTLTCSVICADSMESDWACVQVPLEGVQTSTPATSSGWFPPKDHRSPGMYCKVFFRMLSAGSFSRISSSLRFRLKNLMWQNKQLEYDSAMFLKSQVYLGGRPLAFIWIIRGGLLGKGAAILWYEVFAKTRQKAFKSKSHSSGDLPLGLQPWIGTVGSLQSVTDYPN